MRKHRFFCEHIDTECTLDAAETNHLCRALRVKEGDGVELFDGQGTLAEAIVTQIGKKQATLRASGISHHKPRSAGRIILAAAFAKGQRFDWLVEKCTELGVDHIIPTIYHRTVKLGKSSVVERLEKVALAAVKQSERVYIPEISVPAKLEHVIGSLQTRYPRAAYYFGDPAAARMTVGQSDSEQNDVVAFIGPEGGLTEEETGYLKSRGATPVSLNENILRVETAAVAFCTCLASNRVS